jgi:hypothetical protein
MMNAPKLLPWYARKCGVPLDRAEALWRKAVRNATAETGWVGTSDDWGAAMNTFMALLKAEQATLCAPRVMPHLRSQNWLWSLPLQAFEDMIQVAAAYWHLHRLQLSSGRSTTRRL